MAEAVRVCRWLAHLVRSDPRLDAPMKILPGSTEREARSKIQSRHPTSSARRSSTADAVERHRPRNAGASRGRGSSIGRKSNGRSRAGTF